MREGKREAGKWKRSRGGGREGRGGKWSLVSSSLVREGVGGIKGGRWKKRGKKRKEQGLFISWLFSERCGRERGKAVSAMEGKQMEEKREELRIT